MIRALFKRNAARMARACLAVPLALHFSAPLSAQTSAEACDAWAATDEAWTEIETILRQNYAYLGRVDDLDGVFANGRFSAAKVTSVKQLGSLVETFGYAFRDGHFHVRPALAPERAWIPSSSDFWLVLEGESWIVADVKFGSQARNMGIRPGWEAVQMDGQPIADLAAEALRPLVPKPTNQQLEYAANVAMSGRLNQARSFTFRSEGKTKSIDLPAAQQSFAPRPSGNMQVSEKDGTVHIRFNNSLGENAVIKEFDTLMERHAGADAIIIDLRDTPGGGNTTVARAILGHFIDKPAAYQWHRNAYEEAVYGVRRQYAEYVFPRGKHFAKPVTVLAGYWTGSVGEAVAVAFDQAVGAHTIGTPLGDLLGTLNRNSVQNNCMTLSFAWDSLMAPNGMPREDWVPAQAIGAGDTGRDGGDPALTLAIQHLAALKNQ